jgi:hypothetical protein
MNGDTSVRYDDHHLTDKGGSAGMLERTFDLSGVDEDSPERADFQRYDWEKIKGTPVPPLDFCRSVWRAICFWKWPK